MKKIYLNALYTAFAICAINSNAQVGVTKLGTGALAHNTTGGDYNTGLGYYSLTTNTSGNHNTATGAFSMYYNTTGIHNTASGAYSLLKNTTGESNTASGFDAMYNNTTGSYNSGFGMYSLNKNTIASYNTATGYAALYSNTTGAYNTANGYQALFKNLNGSRNTAVGYRSLYANTANYNTGIGYAALFNNTSGTNNTATGYAALYHNTTGSYNTANGYEALYLNTTGSYNTAYGHTALASNTTDGNTAFGYASLYSNTTGTGNVATGYQSLTSNTTGLLNTAIGYRSLLANTTGWDNTATGYKSLTSNTTGNYNTGIGYKSLITNITGSGITAVGYYADVTASNLSNATAIGYGAQVNASNKVVIGNSSVLVIGGFSNWHNFSDGRFKKDIQQNVPGLSFINKLRPVTYHIDQEKLQRFLGASDSAVSFMKNDFAASDKKLRTGFIAQEVEKTSKEINYDFDGVNAPQNDKDNYSIAYADFVPSLVKAIQELSKANDSKDSLIKDLQKQINQLKSVVVPGGQTQNIKVSDLSTAALQQNAPNPFNSTTIIRYHIPASTTNAQIMITNARGNMIKTFALNNKGAGSVTIQAGELSAGSYYYTLIVDGKKVDSKQMILNK